MSKKRLQLSEIKIHSSITPVNPSEQKTTKGGFVHRDDMAALNSDISYVEGFSWTELKTRISSNDMGALFVDNNLK